MGTKKVSRREFLRRAGVGAAALTIVPRSVLGGPGQTPPSESLGGALIGCGGRGGGTFSGLGSGVKRLAECDVKFEGAADNKKRYTDFRRVLERKDVDVVAIATPPHWHALITIAAMQAGKDVLCEKPLTRFIAEGRAVVDAETRYGRIVQVGTYGRYRAIRDRNAVIRHKIMRSGIYNAENPCPGVHYKSGGLKVKQWSGYVNAPPQECPSNLDWDMYCGPSPLRPYHKHRFGGSHRGYWDYDGGGLSDMGQHHFDPMQWTYGKDDTSPVEVDSFAPPAHPLACGMWGWVEQRYADGFTVVMESTEWGKRYDRKPRHEVSLDDLKPQDRKKVEAMPDPKVWPSFPEAVKTRQKTGGCGEAAHRAATILHLANISIRVGRKIKYDPVAEQIIGDDEANRLVNQPMRAPWHL